MELPPLLKWINSTALSSAELNDETESIRDDCKQAIWSGVQIPKIANFFLVDGRRPEIPWQIIGMGVMCFGRGLFLFFVSDGDRIDSSTRQAWTQHG
jgi:hypothetical protein